MENTHVGMRDLVSGLRTRATCSATMEYGLKGRYYMFQCRQSEGEVPQCAACGLVPASGRRYEELGMYYRQWLQTWQTPEELVKWKELFELSCCASCTTNSKWETRKTEYLHRAKCGPHCTSRLRNVLSCNSF